MKLYTPRPEPRNTARLTQVIARLFVLRQHEDRVQQLCFGKQQTASPTDQARAEAQRLTRKATHTEIEQAIAEIENSYGRYYEEVRQKKHLSTNPADDIFELLRSAQITVAELNAWTHKIKTTQFPLSAGTPVQPLPNLPESNAIMAQVISDLKPDKAIASQHLAVTPTPLTRAEILEAIGLDYWGELPHAAKIEAWRMIPQASQTAIKLRCGQDKEAIKAATRDYHLDEIRQQKTQSP